MRDWWSVSIENALFYILISSIWEVKFLHILANTLLSVTLLLIIVIIIIISPILVDMKWYFIVVLFSILLMADDLHFFMWLLGTCISFIDKWLFMIFVHVLIGLFLFLFLTCVWSLQLLYTSLLWDKMICRHLNPLYKLSFYFLVVSIEEQNL